MGGGVLSTWEEEKNKEMGKPVESVVTFITDITFSSRLAGFLSALPCPPQRFSSWSASCSFRHRFTIQQGKSSLRTLFPQVLLAIPTNLVFHMNLYDPFSIKTSLGPKGNLHSYYTLVSRGQLRMELARKQSPGRHLSPSPCRMLGCSESPPAGSALICLLCGGWAWGSRDALGVGVATQERGA